MSVPRHNTWFWLPRRYPNTTQKNVFWRENSLAVGEPGDKSAITGMDIVMTNTFAPVPIVGHNYASAQFIGPGGSQFQVTIHNVGTEVLRSIQSMAEETQENARTFRRVKDCARVYFGDNAFLQLAGIEDAVINSVDSWTEPGTTDLYGLRISFIVDGQHQEALNQEMYSPSSLQWRVIEKAVQDIHVLAVLEVQSITGSLPGSSSNNPAASLNDPDRTMNPLSAVARQAGSPNPVTQSASSLASNAINTVDEIMSSIEVQLREESGGRIGETVLSLFRQDIGIREAVRRFREGDTTEGLGEALVSFGNIVENVTGEIVRTGSLTTAFRNVVNNQLGQAVVIPSPRGANIRDNPLYTNNADPNIVWYKQLVTDVIRILARNRPSLPLHSFFQGPWEGEYLRMRGNSGQMQSQASQQRLREAEARRRAQDEGGPDANPNLSESELRKAGRTAEQTNDRFIRTELHNIPPFLRRVTYGNLRYYDDVNALARPIRSFLAELLSLAGETIREHSGSPEFEQLFPGLSAQHLQARRISVNPAYPDLDLPPHPVSGRVIDTEPDFYFWNDSEESMLNQIGPELDARLNRRLDRMLQSFQGVVNGDVWRQTYLGRSLYGPDFVAAENSYSISGEPPSMEATGDPSSPVNVQVDRETGVLSTLQRQLVGNDPQSVTQMVMMISPSVTGTTEEGDQQITRVNRRSMMTNTVFNLQTEQDNPTMQVGPVDQEAARDEDLAEMNYMGHSSTRDNIYNLAKQAILQGQDETLTMRRAFPTFKLYFIEDDTGPDREHLLPQNRTVAYFDDFYNYNSVKEMRVVRTRKEPGHLAIITLTNVSGILDERMWNAQRWDSDTGQFVNFQREAYEPGLQETELENPLDHLILKQGLKVQLRLGHSNNANKLPIKFNGEIVEIGYNHSSPDLITIVAQGYGAELVAEKKYQTDDTYAGFRDTGDLLHSLMCCPELVHFGRFEVNPQFNPAEARSRISDGTGRWNSPSEILDRYRQHLIMARTPWILANNPADDNIFAPNPQLYREWYSGLQEIAQNYAETAALGARAARIPATWVRNAREIIPSILPVNWIMAVSPPILIEAILSRTSAALRPTTYIPVGSTIWGMFKEMELRHPGYVSDCRPYGTRMTMFFGLPDQRYWASEITRGEMAILRTWEQQFRAARDAVISRRAQRNQEYVDTISENLWRPLAVQGTRRAARYIYNNVDPLPFSNNNPLSQLFNIADVAGLQIPINHLMGQVGTAVGRTFGRFRPFRKYHILTSDHHILLNNIRSSDKNTFNAVTIRYADGKTYTLKADDNIPDYKLKTAYFEFPNCSSETMARRYCIGLLMRGLRDVYKGEIVVTGKNIDPWDAVLLYDAYSDMYGPMEVEQVVDIFTRETGWITEITPDMCIHANEYSTTSTMNLMLDAGTEIFSRIRSSRPASGAVIASTATWGAGTLAGLAAAPALAAAGGIVAGGLAAGAVLAGLGGYYFLKYTQERQPIWINPLIINNRPFTDGLYGFKHDGVFANIAGRFEAEVDRVSEGWRAFHLAGYINDWTVGTSRGLGGQTGQGAYSGIGNSFVVR